MQAHKPSKQTAKEINGGSKYDLLNLLISLHFEVEREQFLALTITKEMEEC